MENNYSELKYDSMREKQSQKKQGILNPMYNKKHNAVTKQKISNSQKKKMGFNSKGYKRNQYTNR